MRLTGLWAVWLALLLACSEASTTFDRLRSISEHAQRTPDDLLRDSLQLSCRILQQHALDSQPVQLLLRQLQQVLQQDCCDYFTALPLIKGLADSLHEVLDLQLQPTVVPVIRRSYVAAMWLLQRSKQFRWNTKYMDKALTQGLYRLYEAHVDVSAGRPISYHHISKSGGTSLCQLARANACKGPVMTKANNCILDTGLDGPVWVFKHESLAANHIPLPPPPAPPPPRPPPPPPRPPRPPRVKGQKHMPAAGDDPFEMYNNLDDDDDDVFDATQTQHEEDAVLDDLFPRPSPKPPVPVANFEWFMYDCPRLVSEKQSYSCDARQEAVMAKGATFFANEHTLTVQHGEPQVCEAFTNVVIVRDALDEAISLMGEVSQVYMRLLRRQSVITWTPPRSDLAWWQQWAPAVISSYSTRTLLGSRAFCPPDRQPLQEASQQQLPGGIVAPVVRGKGGAAGAGGMQLPVLGDEEVGQALRALYAFDVVLDLGRQELMDASLTKLLGWTSTSFSESKPHRSTVPARVLRWEELWDFARQQPRQQSLEELPQPPPPPQAAAAGKGAPQAGLSFEALLVEPGSESRSELSPEVARRLLAEAALRRLFREAGVRYVAWPLRRNNPPPPLPSRVIAAAGAALQRVNESRVTVLGYRDGHMLVQLQEPPEAGAAAAAGPGHAAVGTEAPAGAHLYHIWPVHGFVLDEQQYEQLLASTAADRQLYQHAQLLQLLDVAWLTALGKQRSYIRMLRELVADVSGCGLASLSHDA